MINNKIKTYNLTPADGEALLNYKGRLSSDDLYMQVYSIDKSNSELVNTSNEEETTKKNQQNNEENNNQETNTENRVYENELKNDIDNSIEDINE